MIVSKYITDDFDSDEAVDWAIANCPSFEKYILVELDWEEKQERDCCFRFDATFNNDQDATLFLLRWA